MNTKPKILTIFMIFKIKTKKRNSTKITKISKRNIGKTKR